MPSSPYDEEPTKLPWQLVILAGAVQLVSLVLMAGTLIVTLFPYTTLFRSVAGVMAIVASAQVLLAGALLPAVPSVVRVSEPASVSGMEEVAETTVVPIGRADV